MALLYHKQRFKSVSWSVSWAQLVIEANDQPLSLMQNRPDHPDVAIDVNNLGSVLRALGGLAGARKAFERALRIFQNFFPYTPISHRSQKQTAPTLADRSGRLGVSAAF